MTRTLMTLALMIAATPALAEPVRWVDGQGAVAEIDGNRFRWINLPSSQNADDDYEMRYTTTTDWEPFEWEPFNDLQRSSIYWEMDEVTPHEVLASNGITWRALEDYDFSDTIYMGMHLHSDGRLTTTAHRIWYSNEVSIGGHVWMETISDTLHAVPEPSTLVLLALAGFRWRRST